MARAEAKALGLLAGDGSGIDGYVGFNSTAAFTFDPNNRATAGKFDFIGIAEHEISEAMGRFGLGQNGVSSGRYGPIDLFRYFSHGVLDLVPANGAYFSIDGGTTVINTFNGHGGRRPERLGRCNHRLLQCLGPPRAYELPVSVGRPHGDGCYRLRHSFCRATSIATAM